MLIFVIILIVGTVSPILNDYCHTENCNFDQERTVLDTLENKYSEKSNKKYSFYQEEIETALSKYKPCKSHNCSCHLQVLKQDLEPFKQSGISKALLDSIKTKGTKYQIIQGKLYRDKDCIFPARCSGIEYFILQIIDKLDDMEIIINTRDWPQLNKKWGSNPAPMFSFSKTSDYWDIMYPAWSFWEGGPAIKLYPTGLGKWHQHIISLSNAAENWLWHEKYSIAFFRGSRTSDERDPIVLLSRSHPELVDARYTKNQAWKSDTDTLHAPPAEEVSLEDHCQYKYLFNYRGVAASFRFKHLFLCKSLVFHVGNKWKEFFYPSLKPWVHYVPVSETAKEEEIKELIEFFKSHDDIAKEIAERGYQHIKKHLKMTDVKCYWKKLLKNYGKLLQYKIVRDENLIEIKHNTSKT